MGASSSLVADAAASSPAAGKEEHSILRAPAAAAAYTGGPVPSLLTVEGALCVRACVRACKEWRAKRPRARFVLSLDQHHIHRHALPFYPCLTTSNMHKRTHSAVRPRLIRDRVQ